MRRILLAYVVPVTRFFWRFTLSLTFSLTLITLLASPQQARTDSTIEVTTTADEDGTNPGACSLREAIIAANTDSTYGGCSAGSGTDTITFSSLFNTPQTIMLTSTLTISSNMTIDGPGAGLLTISGNHTVRVLYVNSSAITTIQAVTIANGNAPWSSSGGGIYSEGTLTVSDIRFSGNSAESGGGLATGNTTLTTVTHATFSGNSASIGGGITNGLLGTLTITNSILSGNSASRSGGGIYSSYGTVTITNSTISGNSAHFLGGMDSPAGGFHFHHTTVNLNNSIVANSAAFSDCYMYLSEVNARHSLIEVGFDSCVTYNIDSVSADPALNPDFTLSSTSVAIDAGDDALIPAGITTDLAGNLRIQGVRVDMGAYESPYSMMPVVTISPASTNVNEGANTHFTITRTSTPPDYVHPLYITLNITPGSEMVAEDYTLFSDFLTGQSGIQTVIILGGQTSVNINFAATNDMDAEADNALTIALIDTAEYDLGAATSVTATIPQNDFGVTNPNDSGDGSLRQAITNANAFPTDDEITFTASANGTIALLSALPDLANNGAVTISGNGAANTVISGGRSVRVFHVDPETTAAISGVSITNGQAVDGGGINNEGVLTVSNTTLDGNSASTSGGGIDNSGKLTVTNTTFTDNEADVYGGGIDNDNTLTVINTIFIGNRSETGGAIFNEGALTVTNSTISGNGARTGGGIENRDASNLNNSIVAHSTDGGDCSNSTGIVDVQHSLIEDGSCGVVDGVNGNLTGDPALNPDLTLSAASSALNAGDNALIPVGITTDLAGGPRIIGTTVDMGAFESLYGTPWVITISPVAFTVNEGEHDDFTIQRTGDTTSELSIDLSITPGAGAVVADYMLSGGAINGQTGNVSITIPAGRASVNVHFAAIDDVDAEMDNTLTIDIRSSVLYGLGATTRSTATIPANDTVVTNTDDSGDGSLRQAITNANAFPADDTITFTASANGTIGLLSALPDLANNGALTITGNGTANTIISGNHTVPGFTVNAGVTATIQMLTLANGYTPYSGGGIFNFGTLTVNNITLNGNSANVGGGIVNASSGILTVTNAVFNGNSADMGGAIDGWGTMTVTNSTFSGNSADRYGGGILNWGTMTITNSTFSGNQADETGGGILNSGTLTVTNSTLYGNSAVIGGGVYSQSILNLNNSILAHSASGGECSRGSGTITARYSLIEDGLGCVNGTNSNNLTGDPALNADLTLAPGSRAVNQGANTLAVDAGGNPLTIDRAGNPRIQHDIVDMGAYESSVPPLAPWVTINPPGATLGEGANADFTIARTGGTTSALTVDLSIVRGAGMVDADYTLSGASISGQTDSVTVTIPAGQASVNVHFEAVDDVDAEAVNTLTLALVDGTDYNLGVATSSTATIPQNDLVVTNSSDSGDGSLRQAITNANAFPIDDTITFTASANGTITLMSALPNLAHYGTLTISGNGAANTIISGNDARRVFFVNSIATVNLSGIAITHGYGYGGGIYNEGSLRMTNCVVTANRSTDRGGGIWNGGVDGTLFLINSHVTNNEAMEGGGIYNATLTGTLVVTNSIISGNRAFYGGGLAGGGVLYNSTISDNRALGGGGGIYNFGTLSLSNSIIANSTAGGDCYSSGTINAQHSLIGDGSCGVLSGVNGNLTGNPALNPDLTLSMSSIAIDAGDSSLIPVGINTDLEGNPRIRGASVDMGAYESPYSMLPAQVSILPSALRVSEDTNADFTIDRGDAGLTDLLVSLSIAQESGTVAADYTLSGGSISGQTGNITVTIPAGEASVNVNFAATNDVDAEADNTLTITLVDGVSYDLGASTSATATIPQNDLVVTNVNDDGDGSLRQAITNANTFGGAVTFSGVSTPISLSNSIVIVGNVTVDGANVITVIASGFRAFTITSGTVLFTGLTISGGVDVSGGTVTIGSNPVYITGNNTTMCGGGLHVSAGTVTVAAGSHINGNTTTDNGGGICVDGTGTLIVQGAGTQIDGNSAVLGGGIYAAGTSVTVQTGASVSANTAGGGIYQVAGDLSITDSIIQQNTSGAIRFAASGARSVTGTCIVLNSDTAVVYTGGTGVNATNNWWGSAAGPFSGTNTPNPPNDGNTVGSYGDSVTPSMNPLDFNYALYQTTGPSGCFACTVASSIGSSGRASRICMLIPP